MERSQLVEEGQKHYSETVGAASAIGISEVELNSIWDCTPAFAGPSILGASSSSNHGSHSVAHTFQYRRFQENLNPFSISASHSLTAPSFATNPASDSRHVGFAMATNPVTDPDILVPGTRRESTENNLTAISESDFQGLATFSNTIPKTSPGDKEKSDLDQGSDTSSSPTRRKRRPYSKLQLLHLEREFQLCMYPCRERRVWLSQVLNLTERQVKIWFQNRRTKLKRTMEREKRENEQMQRDMASLAMKFYSAQ